MNIQTGSEFILASSGDSSIVLSATGSSTTMENYIYTYQAGYVSQCWKVCDAPASTKLMSKVNGQDVYLYIEEITAGAQLQTTTEVSFASLWCIVDAVDTAGIPYQKILLLDADGLDTNLFLLVSFNPILIQVNDESLSEENWRMQAAANTILLNTPTELISQQDLKILVPAADGSVALELMQEEDPINQITISNPNGTSLENGVLGGATIQLGSSYLIATELGQPVTLATEPGTNSWQITDDGFGIITIQCMDEGGEIIGTLENDLDQAKLGGDTKSKTKQKWKFTRSGTGLVEH
jgi:hypothetical protein